MRFAELFAGQVVESAPYLVGEQEILDFAAKWDPQWFHLDPDAAATGPFSGLIASGWHTSSIAMRLAVDLVMKDSETLASPGVAYIRWPHPVRPGDRLTLRATMLEVRRASSRRDRGVLRWRWQLFNQDGVEVFDLETTTLFRLPEGAG